VCSLLFCAKTPVGAYSMLFVPLLHKVRVNCFYAYAPVGVCSLLFCAKTPVGAYSLLFCAAVPQGTC